MMSVGMYGKAVLGRRSGIGGLLLGLLLALQPWTAVRAQPPNPVICTDGNQLPPQGLIPNNGPQPDLLVTGSCMAATGGGYYYGNVNILGGGSLDFEQPATGNPDIDFFTSSIVVEANGALEAGVMGTPYGGPRASDGVSGFLTIHLYGKDQSNGQDPAMHPGQGVLCKTPIGNGLGPCGIPSAVWQDNGKSLMSGCGTAGVTRTSNCIPGLPPAASDYFYQYGPLYGDGRCTNESVFTPMNGQLAPNGQAMKRITFAAYK
jgi:hypothetical protein